MKPCVAGLETCETAQWASLEESCHSDGLLKAVWSSDDEEDDVPKPLIPKIFLTSDVFQCVSPWLNATR